MKWHTKNRLLAFLLVFVFAFGLAACNDNDAGETATPAGAVTTTEEAVDATADTVGDAADATVDAAGNAVDATTDTVGDAVDTTGETVNDSLDGATDTVGDAVDTTTDTVGDAADATTDATTDTADITTEPIGDATTDTALDANVELDNARSQVISDMEGLDLTNEDETNVLTVQNTLTTARENLATAYASGDEAAQAQWEELQPQFDAAETALQDNAAEGLQQVQALLEQLQQTVTQ